MKLKNGLIVFGEVLFDLFEDEEVLGGAPFNVSWHLKGFGLNPQMISRVGNDARGKRIIKKMQEWGLNDRLIQRDQQLPTGFVDIRIVENEPNFEIHPDVAFDTIEVPDLTELSFIKVVPLLYHGSLALRSPFNQKSFDILRKKTSANIFFDINLRNPWWEKNQLLAKIKDSTWLKCNADELNTIAGFVQFWENNLTVLAQKLLEYFNLQALFLTKGSAGALVVTQERETFSVGAIKVSHFQDSVGAGDAFSAVSIIGLLNAWPYSQIITRANQFAAYICKIKGAILEDKSIYEQFSKEWNLNHGTE